jgi:hypothetical protein
MMFRSIVRLSLIVLASAALPTLAGATEASQQNRSIVLESLPYNPPPAVSAARPPLQPARLSLRVVPGGGDVLRIGAPFQICFSSTRSGFASVWYIDTQGTVQRLYPNRFTGAVAPVRGGSEKCVGAGSDQFRLIQAGPSGVNDIILLWTQDAVRQPGEGQFRAAGISPERVGDGGYLTLANRDPSSLDAIELFVGGMRSVLVQEAAPAGRWQTRHLRVFAE